MAKIEASRPAAILFFSTLFFFSMKILSIFGKKQKKFAKMKKKVSSRTFLSHPAGLPETELFLWTALQMDRFDKKVRTNRCLGTQMMIRGCIQKNLYHVVVGVHSDVAPTSS